MINNFENIKEFLDFHSDDVFYFIQVLKRRKDNPDMKTDVVVVREYFVDNINYLEQKMPDIIDVCTKHNGRATIRLNKRSYKKIATKMLIDIAQKIDADQFKAVKSSFSSMAGTYPSEKNKTWFLDIDIEDMDKIDFSALEEELNISSPTGEKILKKIPSKTGFHLLVKPFDARQFKNKFPFIDIKKDSPTNLFIP